MNSIGGDNPAGKMKAGEEIVTGLQGTSVVLGVTGSIAAYKAVFWVRSLVEEEARVSVIMTKAATRFVSPLTFGALSGNAVYQDMFDSDPTHSMAHITLGREADVILIAPATATTIARIAHGLADDLLSATVLASRKPVVICPAMNTHMYTNSVTRENLDRLRGRGIHVVDPESGCLACGEEGAGRLAEWDAVRERLLGLLTPDDLRGHHVLVTAGPTREPLDPARYLTNRSSGKMGYALARTAARRGAEVTLISGPVNLPVPPGVTCLQVTTADEMFEAVMDRHRQCSVVVKAAAVADYRPAHYERSKIKKSEGPLRLELTANRDILRMVGERRSPGQVMVGFAAESDNHLAEGKRKLAAKNVDLMVVNDILGDKTGFDVETNKVTLIDREGVMDLPLLTKEQTANRIWNRVVAFLGAGTAAHRE